VSFPFWIIIAAIAGLGIWLLLNWFNRKNRVEVYTPQNEARQLARLKPYFRREIVEAKAKSLFPQEDPAEILQLLDGVVSSFAGLERKQLDILKLSNGNLDQLRYYIEIANSERDFRKITQLAEYPESSKRNIHDKDLFWGPHKREIERDFQQYLSWLKKK
jgi:hypothetical protein